MFRITKLKSFNNLFKSIGNRNAGINSIFRSLISSSPKHFTNEENKASKYTTFEDMTAIRRIEAQKSLLVQVNSEKSHKELCSYCSQFGKLRSSFYYNLSEDLNFILLEFDEISGCEEALRSSSFNEDHPAIPVISPFLWFKARDSSKPKSVDKNKEVPNLIHQEVKCLDENKLDEILTSAETIDDQILILHRLTQLNELGIRIRYLAGHQLEMALNGMFPKIQACLFGSSVNGFGKIGCDLDLILRLNDDCGDITGSRLIYHTKMSRLNGRSQTQRQMEVIGDLMHIFLPAINNVRKILNARVPIIKYNHECLDLDIDFSMSNMTGFYMSELLYLYGEIDERVRPLVFCLRKWASVVGLTNSSSPGRWITNFSLTVMVLFFLQNVKNPILPSMSVLTKSASPNDIRVTDDNINCTFLRDLNKLSFKIENTESLHHLLLQFFEFYSTFNFQQNGISLIEGRPIVKPDHSAIWITNPLEPLLNVSKNVSYEELEKLKLETRNAAWILESTIDKNKDPSSWGLMSLLRSKKRVVKPEMFFKSRIVDVTDLFKDDSIKDYDNISYKNTAIKSAVKQIQKSTQREITKLMKNI
ncbi:unnamed protein product [Chironomus riparius]|uniref:Poly(A) RNA polymerase, mitochondrial n=1 Tax=Chironomus riparius TaxID=315576 RepID=A0A9N9RRI3_9DIPT|nr:unnamed protein product [Chironomus riparius]